MNNVNAVKRHVTALVAAGRAVGADTRALLASPLARAAVGAAALVGAGSASAAATTIDVTDVISTITGGVTTLSSIGIAVVSLVVVIKLFKWVQRTL